MTGATRDGRPTGTPDGPLTEGSGGLEPGAGQGSWSRRQLLSTVGAAPAVAVPGVPMALRDVARVGPTFDPTPAARLAMHVHGSWSEGVASWEAQLAQAAANGIDVLYLSDHDSRATAYKYMTSLKTADWVKQQSGPAGERTLTATSDGGLRLVVESSNSSPADGALALQPTPFATNRIRTSVSGVTFQHTFGASSLGPGARYEVRVDLSLHPARGGRPDGLFALVYRFGAAAPARFTESGGLVGVVAAPLPAAGTTVRLAPEEDIALLWPTMWPQDNCIYGLSFGVRSPEAGSRAAVTVLGCTVGRRRNGATQVVADQAAMLRHYAPAFPGLRARAVLEVGRNKTHMNYFGIPQYVPDDALDTPRDHDPFFLDFVADVNAAGGVTSLNHPFGYDGPPLDTPAQQAELRRATYTRLAALGVYGSAVMEVAYQLRGHVDLQTHLGLWDTLSRNGFYVTGNGTNDDHGGRAWGGKGNGFCTATWSGGTGDAGVVAALRSGRAFFAHMGNWPKGSLDLRLDGDIPMGSVSVSSASTRRLSILATNLPGGATVELVRGPFDAHGAVDPGTVVARVLTASDFSSGFATLSVSTPGPRFWRVQVRNAQGVVIGGSNPVWTLQEAPARPVPPERRA